MTDPKETAKPPIKTRAPGRLSKGGMFDRVRLPAAPHPIEEILILGTTPEPVPEPVPPVPVPEKEPSQLVPEPVPVPKLERSQIKSKEVIAPERDFTRVANSITREALPAGVFHGSSKKLYDALYLRTRGAVVPVRSIRATRRELMQWTGVRNVKTIHAHVHMLIEAGLIVRTKLPGEHEGSLYEINMPEEVSSQHQTSTKPVPVPVPDPNQKLVLDPYQKLVRVGSGNPLENKGTYGNPKTFFNTIEENDDDEALARLVARLREAAREVTGRETTPAESVRWEEVAEVLVTELKIAAARTSVSSAPAFLAEHLRRRLWKREKGKGETENATLPAAETPDARLTSAQIKACPDCGGTSFYYPHGYEGGVARCKHENVAPSTDDEAHK